MADIDNLNIELPDIGGVDVNIDLSSFGEDVVSEAVISNRYIKPPLTKYPSKFVKYENAQKFAKEHRLDYGERIDAVVAGSFIFGDYIEAYLTAHNVLAKEMLISTLSMSQDNIDSLYNLMTHGYIDKLNLVISHYFYAHEQRNLVPYIYKRLDIDNRMQMAVCGTHTKTCQFLTGGGVER